MAEKQLKIKFGVLKRVDKDVSYYQKEYETQKARIEKMRQEGKDAYDIKQQEQVLQETEAMLPDCQGRREKATQDLADYIEKNKQEEGIAGSELLAEAQALLEKVQSS